ncbi:MAG: hypothetical protein ACI837_002745 [Crocinitomicaceae bacterium]|jgi:hypothetical protein
MTNSEILKSINGEIRTLTKAFEQHKVGQPADLKREWMTPIEVGHALGMSAKTLQRLRNCGALPFSRIHGKLYFKRTDVEQLLENNYHQAHRNHCGCR